MRTVTKPVAIITARRQDIEDTQHGTVAATISSFNSVCMDPDILISFNLTQKSSTLQTLRNSKHFCITFPQNNKAGADLAHFHAFSAPGSWGDRKPQHIPMSYSRHPNSNYPVSAVAWSDLADHHASGLAFAVVCEYQTSAPVGDHVIVTARVLVHSQLSGLPFGWGSQKGSAFDESNLVLAHAHGNYTNPENGGGLDSIWKFDDWTRTYQKDQSIWGKAVRSFYESRLLAVQEAKAMQKGLRPHSSRGSQPSVDTQRAMTLSPSRLNEYEKYYAMRLTQLNSREDFTTLVEDKIDNSRNIVKDETLIEEEQTPLNTYMALKALSGWQQMLVRQKTMLSSAALKEEENLYVERLISLKAQVGDEEPVSATTTDLDTEEARLESIDADSPGMPQTPVQRREQLVRYFEDRLRLVRLAQQSKDNFGNSGDEEIASNFYTEPHLWAGVFIEMNQRHSAAALLYIYRELDREFSEANLRLLLARSEPATRDERTKTVDSCQLRVEYWRARRDLIIKMIADKTATTLKKLSTHASEERLPQDIPRSAHRVLQQCKQRAELLADSSLIKSLEARHRELHVRQENRPCKRYSSNSEDDIFTEAMQMVSRDAIARDNVNDEDSIPLRRDGSLQRMSIEQNKSERDRERARRKGSRSIVIRHFEGEEIPSADNFIDLGNKETYNGQR